MTADFLKDLPSHNADNFTRYTRSATFGRNALEKPKLYIPTAEHPAEQVIITEKTSILLRYLHKQWNKKENPKKRTTVDDDESSNEGAAVDFSLPDGPSTSSSMSSRSASSGARDAAAASPSSIRPRRKMPRTS